MHTHRIVNLLFLNTVAITHSCTHHVSCPLSSLSQMDDGKSIRYKDLYALFEHILEKSMRLEQRDWSESPVKVWVNTFKVFLDEFVTEYKPMHGTISRVNVCVPYLGTLCVCVID